ncbi:hypothetical protein BDB01DRAFT_774069 [Pilobolus umbonatus]|nr:hypothetical protein BDB01DRAFT_774069 [Pilobolus umbonatus]
MYSNQSCDLSIFVTGSLLIDRAKMNINREDRWLPLSFSLISLSSLHMKKSVTFNPNDTILSTYSSTEYDRSYFNVYPLHQYTFRPIAPSPVVDTPIHYNDQMRPIITPLDLSIVPNSRRRALNSPSDNDHHDHENATKKSRKPHLFINTQSMKGPLFFTTLSTHYKYKDEEEEDHGYLIPVTAC